MDIQGADVARPYVAEAGVTYTALVDENNILGELFGVGYVPLHYIIDEFGIYRMKERDPEKITEFLNSEKVNMELVVKAAPAPSMYDVDRLKAMVANHPDNTTAHLMLGDALVQQERYAEGIAEYRKAVELDPESAEGPFRIGRALLRQDRKDEALVELKKAAKLDDGNWIVRKQIWAIEHPEKFYEGNVDYDWQKTQVQQGL
ncbi:tetratricopeptide repeat protein [Candidatus Poribacteria bacterium]